MAEFTPPDNLGVWGGIGAAAIAVVLGAWKAAAVLYGATRTVKADERDDRQKDRLEREAKEHRERADRLAHERNEARAAEAAAVAAMGRLTAEVEGLRADIADERTRCERELARHERRIAGQETQITDLTRTVALMADALRRAGMPVPAVPLQMLPPPTLDARS